jgi:hypothetical protein
LSFSGHERSKKKLNEGRSLENLGYNFSNLFFHSLFFFLFHNWEGWGFSGAKPSLSNYTESWRNSVGVGKRDQGKEHQSSRIGKQNRTLVLICFVSGCRRTKSKMAVWWVYFGEEND